MSAIARFISGFLAFTFLIGCGNNDSDKNNGGNDSTIVTVKDTGKLDELKEFKYDMVISNIPIPFDILMTLNKSGANYNRSILNTPSSVSRYSQNNVKAANLGIFGGDLAYVITFAQYSEVGSFLQSTKKLADELGIPIAFDQQALANFNKYKDNKDSLAKIVFSSYSAVDKTLKSNERLGLASLVVTGGWIEGLYTTTKTLGNTPKSDANKALYEKIYAQHTHLEKLIALLGEFSSGDKFYADMIRDMNILKALYDSVKVKEDMSQEEVVAITTKIGEIRNNLVK